MNPEVIVDQQLVAYNEGNFPVFAACYRADIISYDLETLQLLPHLTGPNFFTHYHKKFTENPKIHCKVVQRLCHHNLVIDKEIVSDYQSRQHSEMVIYEVQKGLISKMWFTKEILISKMELNSHFTQSFPHFKGNSYVVQN